MNKLILLIILSAWAFQAQSAGFDCAKASSTVEKMICADAQLSDLDGLLKVAYKKALANTSTSNDIKTEQKYWLQEVRDACKDSSCLTKAYNARLAQLNAGGLSGKYQRDTEPNSASITIKPVEYQQFHITGDAVWVGNVKTGNVNIGE